MNKGVSNIGRTNKVDAVAIPPVPVTGADNGLTLLAGIVELGGPLIKNTVIDLAAFDFTVQDPFFDYLFFDRSSQFAILGDQNNTASVRTDQANGQVLIGDTLGTVNGSILIVDDPGQVLSFQTNANNYLLLDVSTNLFQIGDISNNNNSTKIDIKDASTSIEMDAGAAGTSLILSGGAGFESATVNLNANPYLALDLTAGIYYLGDINNTGNGSALFINDTAQVMSLAYNGTNFLVINNSATLSYELGDASGVNNATLLNVNDFGSAVIITADNGMTLVNTAATGTFLNINPATGIYQMGDISGLGNGCNFNITNATSVFKCENGNGRLLNLDQAGDLYGIGDLNSAVSGSVIEINGNTGTIAMANAALNIMVGINTTPTLSPFAVASLQNFANNAAAVVGGLGVGDFYRISVAGTSAVAVVQ